MIPILIINLNNSKERKNKISTRLNELGIHNYQFLSAFDGQLIENLTLNPNIFINSNIDRKFQKGEIGIILSHISAIKYAKMLKYESVLILEDDVEICEDFIDRLKKMKSELPFNWEHIYLGGIKLNLNPFNKISDHLYKSVFMMGLHSYIIRNIAYYKVENELMKFKVPADDAIAYMINENRLISYTHVPFFTYQNDNFSYIWNVSDEKKDATINHYKNKI